MNLPIALRDRIVPGTISTGSIKHVQFCEHNTSLKTNKNHVVYIIITENEKAIKKEVYK